MTTIKEKPSDSRFALCIENSECEDLDKRKIYQILPDAEAAQEGYLRVVGQPLMTKVTSLSLPFPPSS